MSNTLQQRPLGTIDGLSVYAVDGAAIKVQHYPDFVEGGNDLRYPGFMPANTIWVDANVAPDQWRAIILHEVVERRLMSQGLTYDEAHPIANRYEMEYRREQAGQCGCTAQPIGGSMREELLRALRRGFAGATVGPSDDCAERAELSGRYAAEQVVGDDAAGDTGVKEAWQMSRDELADAINAHDRPSLQRARPLMAAMFPEYTADNDPWGIHRAIHKGDALPRIPMVQFTSKHRNLVNQALRAGKHSCTRR